MSKRIVGPHRLAAVAALLGLIAAGLAATTPTSAAPADDANGRQFRVLVFTASTAGTHPAAAGVKAIRDLSRSSGSPSRRPATRSGSSKTS